MAKLASISTYSIARLERGESIYPGTLGKVRAVLEQAGVMFIDADESGALRADVRDRYSRGNRHAPLDAGQHQDADVDPAQA